MVRGWPGGRPVAAATGYAVAVLCLLLAARLSAVVTAGELGQVPFTVALFVLPLLYAFPAPGRCWPATAGRCWRCRRC